MTRNRNIQTKQIQNLANDITDEIINLRRYFHQYPELSWKEHKTATHLREILVAEGLRVKSGICGTGLVAELNGQAAGKTLAIRSDMDGLPMYDAKDVSFASKVTGVMHACGHDAHMAMAVGAARVLNRLGFELSGNVRFIFQPSEEAAPSGASELVKEGVMQDVDSIVAFHVDPEMPVGKIGLRAGILTAHCNEFNLTILGKSGHAARPHQAIDTIHLSNRVMSALYEITAKRTQTFSPAVLSIGKIGGGSKANIIPERVDIQGTIRTVDEQSQNEILSAIEESVHAITRSAGGTYQLEFLSPVPSVVNDPQITQLIREAAASVLQEDNIVEIQNVSMGGEDFSWYLKNTPGALIRLGVHKEGEEIRYLHTHHFDIDEQALPIGVALMCQIVLYYFSDSNPFDEPILHGR
ncbi:MAG: M20 family metallopeptidase [bacterium]